MSWPHSRGCRSLVFLVALGLSEAFSAGSPLQPPRSVSPRKARWPSSVVTPLAAGASSDTVVTAAAISQEVGWSPQHSDRPHEQSFAFLFGLPPRLNLATDGPCTQTFSLQSVRKSLIRQEETIIFALIERAQFSRNVVTYTVSPSEPLLWPAPAPWPYPHGPCY